MPWAGEPLHSTLHTSPAAIVYEARLPPAAQTALHSHVGVTAYVVVTAPLLPVRTETVEWETDEVTGEAVPARLVAGELALAPGDAFAFVVADPARPLVHRLITPAEGGAGPVAARIVGVEVRDGGRGAGGRSPGEEAAAAAAATLPPQPPFTLAAAGPGFRTLRLVLEAGATASLPALASGSVIITVRGGGGLADGAGGAGGSGRGGGCGGAPSAFVAAAATAPDGGVLVVDAEQARSGPCSLVNEGAGVYEAAVVELT